jgi:hypothetical protein
MFPIVLYLLRYKTMNTKIFISSLFLLYTSLTFSYNQSSVAFSLPTALTFECFPKQLGGGCQGIDAKLKSLSDIHGNTVVKITNISLDFSNSIEISNLSNNDEIIIPLMHVFDKNIDNIRIKTLYLHPGINSIRIQVLKDDKEIFQENLKTAISAKWAR